ncbi:MAG: GntR family transcriptional regulator [Geminicoccaceae bacterium]
MANDHADESSIYDILREDLIWGRWRSGEQLKPQHLKDELTCTSGVLREALLRLSGEGLVALVKNSGFRVASYDEETFREAAHLRLLLECEAAELSVKRGDFEWEMAVNTAHHNLAYIEDQMATVDDITPFAQRWSMLDWAFHSAVLSACGSKLLMRRYRSVYDTFRMYAAARIDNFGFLVPETIDEHRVIFEAAIARDADGCIEAIKAHLRLYHDESRSTERLRMKKQKDRQKRVA